MLSSSSYFQSSRHYYFYFTNLTATFLSILIHSYKDVNNIHKRRPSKWAAWLPLHQRQDNRVQGVETEQSGLNKNKMQSVESDSKLMKVTNLLNSIAHDDITDYATRTSSSVHFLNTQFTILIKACLSDGLLGFWKRKKSLVLPLSWKHDQDWPSVEIWFKPRCWLNHTSVLKCSVQKMDYL